MGEGGVFGAGCWSGLEGGQRWGNMSSEDSSVPLEGLRERVMGSVRRLRKKIKNKSDTLFSQMKTEEE